MLFGCPVHCWDEKTFVWVEISYGCGSAQAAWCVLPVNKWEKVRSVCWSCCDSVCLTRMKCLAHLVPSRTRMTCTDCKSILVIYVFLTLFFIYKLLFCTLTHTHPEGRPGGSDVSPLSGISRLPVWSHFSISPLVLSIPATHSVLSFSAFGPFSGLFSLNLHFPKGRLFCVFSFLEWFGD